MKTSTGSFDPTLLQITGNFDILGSKYPLDIFIYPLKGYVNQNEQ